MVAYEGEHFWFGKLRMSPTPGAPVPIYVGGHTETAVHRAARVGDGWTSAMMRLRDIRSTVDTLTVLREELGWAGEPFEIQAVGIDRFGLDG